MRHLGTAGNEKRISQIKATATNFKRLIGLPWEHHVVQSMASGTFAAPYKLIKCNETGGAAVQLPDGNVYAIQQVMAMFLGKMKEIAEGWFQNIFYFEIYSPNLFTSNARIFLVMYLAGDSILVDWFLISLGASSNLNRACCGGKRKYILRKIRGLFVQ